MFSIIVPVYRVEEYLRECIDSILAQTHREFELILVDDGSPDHCGAICDEYAQKDMRVHVVHKPNGGLVSARKAGVAVSQGEYICFVDGDDFVATDMLETYDQIISNSKADIICTGFSKWFDNQTTQVIQNLEPGFYGNERLQAEIYPHMLSATPFFSFLVWPSVCAKCIRKEIVDGAYEKIPNDITMGEDVAVTYPALLQANSIYVTDYCGYMYRQNQSSMTHTYDASLLVRLKNLLNHLYETVGTHSENYHQQINDYAAYMLLWAKNNELIYNRNADYATKSKKLREYLNEPVFQNALMQIYTGQRKLDLQFFLLRHKLVLPLHIWSMLRHTERK